MDYDQDAVQSTFELSVSILLLHQHACLKIKLTCSYKTVRLPDFTISQNSFIIRNCLDVVQGGSATFRSFHWPHTGGSISPKFKAILEIIVCLFWGHHCVKQPKLHQILKKNWRDKNAIYLRGVEVVIFGLSKNREFSKKRHKTVMLYRSEPNFVLNERLDLALSFEITDIDIWHLQPPIWEKKGKILIKLWQLIVWAQNASRP